ncbi:ABC transporter permease [Roseburia sp. MSJ-14]|uniref:ABC transporter permease n=1 Tax=Roseburia sp. MSJ-14 TaxID=2841514 RepID=UPI001C103C7F|nr:ABC transporter permease [Roseburia sp. MSJ-14]MBU5472963.1 ABC transporter permease [Roseburia sp. MSJ-14]
MKNNILTVMKKEFTRFFTDKRMVLTTIFLPGIMIYLLYTFMGSGLSGQLEQSEDFKPAVYVENLPESVKTVVSQGDLMELKEVSNEKDVKDVKEKISDGDENYNLLAVFPENFDAQIAAYDSKSGEEAPNVELYYNSTETDSSTAYNLMTSVLDQIESAMANKFDINAGNGEYDLASEEDMTAQMFSMMIPMLMIMFLFSGCMAVAPESIAGEKERGTIATLLVTPMKRSHLALGKILSLSVIAILSGCSSFLGTMLSLPNLMGGAGDISANVYGVKDYVMLFFIIISTVMVIVSVIAIVSAFAKSVKEATGWVTPIMLISMLIGITSMIDSLCKTEPVWYLIPLYNSVQSMNGVFSLNMNVTNIIVTVIANFCYAGIGVFVLTKMFNSEKVMFSK